jgi:RHS repeat-associated protein
MHARYYGSNLARFMRPDPLALKTLMERALAQPQAWNLYSYVQGNPVLFTDPTGMTLQYSDEFRKRLKTDANFRKGFEAWKKTDIGHKQWKAMKKDRNTLYTITVGTKHQDAEAKGETRAATYDADKNAFGKLSDVTVSNGTVDAQNVTIMVDADRINWCASNDKSGKLAVELVADNLGHESLHAEDIGSGKLTSEEKARNAAALDVTKDDPRDQAIQDQVAAVLNQLQQ